MQEVNIAIDGGQTATYGSPPILSNDFGIPTLPAVVRAVNHLKQRNVKRKISLIISSVMLTLGHFLKVLTCTANAVHLGSPILFAVSHGQSIAPLSFGPPTQVVWYNGKFKNPFKVEEGIKRKKSP